MELLGKGIYTVSTASRILTMSPQKIRRWVQGYTYAQRDGGKRDVPPIFTTDFQDVTDDAVISFLDLSELLFIKNFIDHGISLQKVRKAAAYAAQLMSTDHPFAMKRIYTDGKSIFAKLAKETGDKALIDLLTTQYQFEELVEPFLYECIDFNQFDCAEKWWPNGKDKDVVLDPERNFGQPILNKFNVRTEVIFDLYRSNHSVKDIHDWYGIDTLSINAAIEYEEGKIA